MDSIKRQYKKLGQNTLWMFVGNFATKLLSFFMVPLYTAYLSTTDYGTADLMTTTVSLLSPILTVSASEGVLRFTLDKKYDSRQVLSLSLTISTVGFIILLLLSPVLRSYAILIYFMGVMWFSNHIQDMEAVTMVYLYAGMGLSYVEHTKNKEVLRNEN